jgi:multimeric flavodoxin WrbA
MTRKAGRSYADPDYDLSIDWIEASKAVARAQRAHDARDQANILIVNSSPRTEHTCPGEMSKSYRLVEIAAAQLRNAGATVSILDLSLTASEYGRKIYPCKACFSTSPALCHWPCSCYPNHSLGQTQDWMNDIYPLWVAAHGVMLVTPVHWYQATSPLKLMIDRLVCADGGNPDPTLTGGKDAAKAKAIEAEGWHYPRHLAGRHFSVIVHGDAEGAENLRRSLADWMSSMEMIPAPPKSQLDRYLGYWEPYWSSHNALDKDSALQTETSIAALTLLEAVRGKPVKIPKDPRQK